MRKEMMRMAALVAWGAMPMAGVFAGVPFDMAAASPAVCDTAQTVLSPDGNTFLTVGVRGGRPYYRAGRYGQDKKGRKEILMLEDSPLGLETNIGSFSRDMEWKKSESRHVDERYALTRSKVDEVHKVANTLTVTLPGAVGPS